MKKLVVTLLVLSFVLAGVSLAAADNLPKSLKGVDLKAAQKVTDKEAKEVKGSARNPSPGIAVMPVCPCITTSQDYLYPGPHK